MNIYTVLTNYHDVKINYIVHQSTVSLRPLQPYLTPSVESIRATVLKMYSRIVVQRSNST